MRRILAVAFAATLVGSTFACNQILGNDEHTLDKCTPNSTSCDTANNVLVCADGQSYTMSMACPFVCLNGACTGSCSPGSQQCSNGAPQTCDATGTWQTGTCPTGQTCNNGTCSGGCFIGGSSYASGTANPGNPCQSCQPGTTTTAWSNVTNGMSCGSGEVCNAGVCAVGCYVGGTVYPTGMTNPNEPCQTCQPTMNTQAWSNIMDGTACGNGQVCSSGKCGTQCDIGGMIYPTGTANPSNACQDCEPGTSTTMWTTLSAGTSCGTGEVCNGSTCAAGCFIGGVVYSANAADPASTCQTCQPATTTTSFSKLPDGTTCASAEICSSGSCVSGCDIGMTIYNAGAVNSANACQSCVPATSTSAWTTNPSGTLCSNACVNLQTDPNNCGQCGRVCPATGACTAGVCVNTFSFTGGNQTYTVPAASCGTLTLELWGAGGGDAGGGGGYTQANVTPTPGQSFTLIVGQGGINNTTRTFGGGGGGSSDGAGQGGGRSAVQISGLEVLTAGGGGGGFNLKLGGAGGGLSGQNGTAANPGSAPTPQGGTQTSGGAGTDPAGINNNGAAFLGGDCGANGILQGGGGGAGRFGGGGNGTNPGGSGLIWGGGAGGSGFCGAAPVIAATCMTTAGVFATGAHQTGDWVSPAGNGGPSGGPGMGKGGDGLIVVRCGN